MTRLALQELHLDLQPDCALIHAVLMNGEMRRSYRVKCSHLSGELLFNRLVREYGMKVDDSGTFAAKEIG